MHVCTHIDCILTVKVNSYTSMHTSYYRVLFNPLNKYKYSSTTLQITTVQYIFGFER